MTETLNIISSSSDLKTLRPGDPHFNMVDGMILGQRAGFEIDPACPKYYKAVIVEAINNGWLRPIATVREHELNWEIMSK